MKIGSRGEFEGGDYQQWPVFYGVREEPKFADAFKSIFGIGNEASLASVRFFNG